MCNLEECFNTMIKGLALVDPSQQSYKFWWCALASIENRVCLLQISPVRVYFGALGAMGRLDISERETLIISWAILQMKYILTLLSIQGEMCKADSQAYSTPLQQQNCIL